MGKIPSPDFVQRRYSTVKQKRALSGVLALVLALSLLPAPLARAAGTATYNGKTYSTDYTTWRQGDSAWGNTALGDLHTMAGSGCLVTSIAILMCHSGAYDPSTFNPGVFRDWLDSKGYISHSSDRSKDALLSFGRITSTSSPRFYFVNQTFFSVSTPLADVVTKINDLLNSGYYVIARVKNSGHFVPIARTVGGDAQLYDPGAASKKLLSEYNGTIGGLIYFKANLSGKDTILPSSPAKPAAPQVGKLSSVYGDGDLISVSWSPVSLATHYNIYVDRKNSDGSWQENYRYYFYTKSPYSMERLPAGTYRIKVQSTNANNWSYANSAYQTFTVKENHLTITYNANGGSVSPGAELVSKNSTYDLPTPTRKNAAFLGWYTAVGKELVTNGTKLKSTYGQTLVAKWDTSGHSFVKSKTYQNNFKDVSSRAWYYPYVTAAYSYGLMDGIETNKFKPDKQISAAQTITLAARLRKLYLTGNGTFANSSPWYKAYSDYAISQGIISSLPSDMNAPLTRQEFASILAKALPSSALPSVNDVPDGSIPDVYKSDKGIYQLYRAGVLSGNDDAGTFRPNAPITRAEVASVLVRMADPNTRILFSLD